MSDRIDHFEAELLDMRRRQRRLTATNLVLAGVVLAFGGVGAAYALAPANSVNSASIIDRSIGTPDVKVGAFAGQTILDNSMTTKDINEVTLTLPVGQGFTAATTFPPGTYLAQAFTNVKNTIVGYENDVSCSVTANNLSASAQQTEATTLDPGLNVDHFVAGWIRFTVPAGQTAPVTLKLGCNRIGIDIDTGPTHGFAIRLGKVGLTP